MYRIKKKPFWQRLVRSLVLWKPVNFPIVLCVWERLGHPGLHFIRGLSPDTQVGCLLESLDEQECHFPVPELAECPPTLLAESQRWPAVYTCSLPARSSVPLRLGHIWTQSSWGSMHVCVLYVCVCGVCTCIVQVGVFVCMCVCVYFGSWNN